MVRGRAARKKGQSVRELDCRCGISDDLISGDPGQSLRPAAEDAAIQKI